MAGRENSDEPKEDEQSKGESEPSQSQTNVRTIHCYAILTMTQMYWCKYAESFQLDSMESLSGRICEAIQTHLRSLPVF